MASYEDDHDGSDAIQWSVSDDRFKASGHVCKTLPPGAYDCQTDDWGNATLIKTELKLDELISFPDTVYSDVLERIDKFWDRRSRYHDFGFLHRMGYLLYGPQGCGKSSLVYQIMHDIVKKGHLCLLSGYRVDRFVSCVDTVRKIEPDRPVVCVMEDIDTHMENGYEGTILQWLDGANKCDHIVVIATTNYPEKLDKRVVCRPRRFDRVLYIGAPDAHMRYRYFEKKLKTNNHSKLSEWTLLSEGLSFAGLAELVISVECMDNDLIQTAVMLKNLEANRPSSDEFAKLYGKPSALEPHEEEYRTVDAPPSSGVSLNDMMFSAGSVDTAESMPEVLDNLFEQEMLKAQLIDRQFEELKKGQAVS